MLNTDLSHMLLEFTDIWLWHNEFDVWGSLFTKSRQHEDHRYSVNHVSRDHWRHSQSSTEFANSWHFTGSPVRGSLNTQSRHSSVLYIGIRNIRCQDYSFPGTFVLMMELSFSGPFIPWNIRSLDRSFPGTFVPGTVCSLEHSLPG